MRERKVKTNLLSDYFPLLSMVILTMVSGIALADDTAAAPTTQNTTQASATPANDSQCPCNFKEAMVRSEYTRIAKGTIDCVITNAILFIPGKAGPTKQLNSIVLTSLGTPADGSSTVMNAWGVTLTLEPENDPNGKLVNVCGKNLQGSKVKSVIKNDTQVQACIADIEHAASMLGVSCEEKS